MTKILVLTGLLLVLALSLFTSLTLASADLGNIWYVAPHGDDTTGHGTKANPWRTIQHTINAAGSGDTIRVAQGTYRELLTITTTTCKTLTLEGGWNSSFETRSADPALTVIDGRGAGNVVSIIAATPGCDINVIMDGFTITKGQAIDGAGVHIKASGLESKVAVSLKNNIIAENYADWGGGVSAMALDSAIIVLTSYTKRDLGQAPGTEIAKTSM